MRSGWKETLRRALRTFFQAAIGYVAANIALVNWHDESGIKASITAIITAAVAFGIAAIMNLPPDGVEADETDEEQKEHEEEEKGE